MHAPKSPTRYRAGEWPTPELPATLKAHAIGLPSE
jgi:hypothetical protein